MNLAEWFVLAAIIAVACFPVMEWAERTHRSWLVAAAGGFHLAVFLVPYAILFALMGAVGMFFRKPDRSRA